MLCLQASSTVEVDIQTAEKLLVNRLDFMAALNNDIKPVRCCKLSVCHSRVKNAAGL